MQTITCLSANSSHHIDVIICYPWLITPFKVSGKSGGIQELKKNSLVMNISGHLPSTGL